MTFTRTLLALSLGFAVLQAPVHAAPPQSLNNGQSVLNDNNNNAWLEIDVAAFEHNIRTLQAELGGKSQLCAVMKADAYGHGIGLLMPSVIRLGVPCVAVASNEEARVVRASGFKGRLIRVRTATLSEVEAALKYDMEELVGSLEFARQAATVARQHRRTLTVHLGLNSAGMSRNGLDLGSEQGKQDALALTRLPLRIAGIMTHFPVEDKDEVRKGLAAFNAESEWLIREAKLDRRKLLLHAANSFATLEVPESRLDMVRPGGALYGDTVPTYTQYRPLMTFKTKVASVNRYPAGNTVGYDRTFTLKRDSVPANLPLGYSDGYRRTLSNKGYVLVNGQRAPVVGRVSMNTTMVDVTDIPGVKAGDEVVLFGKQGAAEISRNEIVSLSGTLLVDLGTNWDNANPKVALRRR